MIAPSSLAGLRAARVMEEMLQRGFTTMRDLGGADHGLVRGVEEGLIDGPRLVICGKGLTTTGGHADLRKRTDDRPRHDVGPARLDGPASSMASTKCAPPAAR